MRPRNPVACSITIGAPSPPQSRVCSRMPLTFTKLLKGSVFSIFKFASWYAPGGFGGRLRFRSNRLLLNSLCLRRANIFERDRLEKTVAHRIDLRQHEVHARIAVAGAAIELDGFDRVGQDDRGRLASQEQSLIQGTATRIGLEHEA